MKLYIHIELGADEETFIINKYFNLNHKPMTSKDTLVKFYFT